MLARIQLRRDVAASWTSVNPVLRIGEVGIETDTNRLKIGDGINVWNLLPYFGAASSGLYSHNGTFSSPNIIVASSGLGILNVSREYQFLKSNGGPIVVTANPQIQPGTSIGQELLLQGVDMIDTVTLDNGNGLDLNGSVLLYQTLAGSCSRISLVWDGNVWGEVARNDI